MSSLKARKSSKTKPIDAAPANAVTATPPQVVIGHIAAIGANGEPIVDYPSNPTNAPLPALATARYDIVMVGAPVALMFLAGDPTQPLAIGVVATPPQEDSPRVDADAIERTEPPERLLFEAAREIVLQCGRASIVLTRAGKLLLRGAYVSSRSTGMQRITGASVHIN